MNSHVRSHSATRPGPLSGLKVLEVSRHVSAAYTGKLLGDYGAEVVKVEPPAGDPARFVGPFSSEDVDPDASGLFLFLNSNKRSVSIDPEEPSGRELLLRLVAGFDVLVENYPPGYLEECGLDREHLAAARPDLIVARISAFGQGGPYKEYKATDLVLQAMSGMMQHNGDAAREPLKLPGPQAFFLGGAHAAVATLAALRRRRAQPGYQEIDVATMLCGSNVIVPSLTSFAYAGVVTVRRAGGRGTWSVYPCADGAVTISVYHTGREWADFVAMVDRPGLRDSKFETASGRNENIEELEAEILAWTMSKSKLELADLGRQHRIAIGMEATVSDVLAYPQLAARDFFRQMDHPTRKDVVIPGPPVVMSKSPWALRRRPPRLGEHTAEVIAAELGSDVLEEFGLSKDIGS